MAAPHPHDDAAPIPIRRDPNGALLLAIKAVPGAKRDEIVGQLGERLKVRISAPPEDGKANKAIIALLARSLGLRKSDIMIVEGTGSAEKVVRIEHLDEAMLRGRLGI